MIGDIQKDRSWMVSTLCYSIYQICSDLQDIGELLWSDGTSIEESVIERNVRH